MLFVEAYTKFLFVRYIQSKPQFIFDVAIWKLRTQSQPVRSSLTLFGILLLRADAIIFRNPCNIYVAFEGLKLHYTSLTTLLQATPHVLRLPSKTSSRYSNSNFPLDIGPSTGIYKLIITIWPDECMQSTGRQSKTRNFTASTLPGRYLRGKRVPGVLTAEFREVLMKFILCF